MKKIISFTLISFFLIIIFGLLILSTNGIETERFNNLILKKINQTSGNIKLTISSIKFKLDLREASLYAETTDPQIIYREIKIPAKNIKVYIDFLSLIKSAPSINKINLSLAELNIEQVKDLTSTIKPSNLRNIINTKIKSGKVILNIEFFLINNKLDNFITKGSIKNLNKELIKNLVLEKTNFNFFSDKSDILLKNINGEVVGLKISDGDLKLNLSNEISLKSNLPTIIKIDSNKLKKFYNFIGTDNYLKNIDNFEANLSNNLNMKFDKTYKLLDYNFESKGTINRAVLKLNKPIKSDFLSNTINEVYFFNSSINSNLNLKENKANIIGKYSFNNKDFFKFNLNNIIQNNKQKLELDMDFEENIKFNLINFVKKKGEIANLIMTLERDKKSFNIRNLKLTSKKNLISISNLKFKNKNLLSFTSAQVRTYNEGKKNNDFIISFKEKIKLKGDIFDSTNLAKVIKDNSKSSQISKITKNIEIEFKNVLAPLSENLTNFKLIGSIENGKFTKISSKGDFGNQKYLDIMMKNDKKNKKKYLEVYSDLPKPLLVEYDFFKGLSGGKLLFSSIIDENSSISKLKIENFKVINAPGMVKLLSLADLGGLADLAKGEGLSFDILEINMRNSKGLMKFDEIYADGSSMSVLMDGYQELNGVTSLRGTLIPAKNLNKLISKIPVLGDLIIPKEVGEGLFGVSFKMKGPPGKIKTTINPIRTLTPRFIQKIIDKDKKTK